MGPWATANYCRAGIKSLRGTVTLFFVNNTLIHCQLPKIFLYLFKNKEIVNIVKFAMRFLNPFTMLLAGGMLDPISSQLLDPGVKISLYFGKKTIRTSSFIFQQLKILLKMYTNHEDFTYFYFKDRSPRFRSLVRTDPYTISTAPQPW